MPAATRPCYTALRAERTGRILSPVWSRTRRVTSMASRTAGAHPDLEWCSSCRSRRGVRVHNLRSFSEYGISIRKAAQGGTALADQIYAMLPRTLARLATLGTTVITRPVNTGEKDYSRFDAVMSVNPHGRGNE
jgi:hypothetical protein